MVLWKLARKDLRLLVRDFRALIILLLMPLALILVLGVSLGEGFGQKPEDRLRVSVLVEDAGLPRRFDRPAMIREGLAWWNAPLLGQVGPGLNVPGVLAAASLARTNHDDWFPHVAWSEMVLRDLGETADIKVEIIPDRDEAQRLVRTGKRAAVLVLGRDFSKRVQRCSFLAGGWTETLTFAAGFPRGGDPVLLALAGCHHESQEALPLYLVDGINPFFREGIRFDVLDVEVLRDPTQQTAAAIIDQVAQGSLLRVIMPWMIGRAFGKVADPEFLELLAQEKTLPASVKFFLTGPFTPASEKRNLSRGLQNAIQNLYSKYDLTAKTWSALTREPPHRGGSAGRAVYYQEGAGLLQRGALRYQILVPSYLVMFAFFLVLSVGWLFTSERRQGTLQRLRLAPLTRLDILLGKFVPGLVVALVQGSFLLLAGKLLFGMHWGPHPGWLFAVVAATALAAAGLALVVAAAARTETQVAVFGTLLVLVLAGLSGSLMGDRALMPETMQQVSRLTPHAWALDAYRQLLTNPQPDLALVGFACLVLTAFGLGFVLLAWGLLRLE